MAEKAMAPHSSTLAWKIPWMEEPGGLQSMGSQRVRHDWATSLWLFTFMHWRRKWQPTPVFLPGESQGRRSLVGCRLWGPKSQTRLKRLSSSSSSSKIMASSPVTSWEIDGETVETVSDFILWGSKVTADGDCSHEIIKDTYSLEGKL